MEKALVRRKRSSSGLRFPVPTPVRDDSSIRNILRPSSVQPKLKVGAANDLADYGQEYILDLTDEEIESLRQKLQEVGFDPTRLVPVPLDSSITSMMGNDSC